MSATLTGNKREAITAKVTDILKQQRSVKFGKVQRDPIQLDDLPKTAFPAIYVETSDEDIEDLHVANPTRRAQMEVAIILSVGGRNRDTQRNIAIEAMENSLLQDKTLGGLSADLMLTRVETITTGESAPFASCRVIFLVEYYYQINIEE